MGTTPNLQVHFLIIRCHCYHAHHVADWSLDAHALLFHLRSCKCHETVGEHIDIRL